MNRRDIHDRFSVAEQLFADHFDELVALGFSDVICNRPDHEDPGQPTFADLVAAAEAHELKLHHLPVDGPVVDSSIVVAMRTVLDDADGRVLGFCRTGNRSLMLFERAQSGA